MRTQPTPTKEKPLGSHGRHSPTQKVLPIQGRRKAGLKKVAIEDLTLDNEGRPSPNKGNL
jgi:hypothetical protein